jgi:hypothetical protein
MRFEGEGLSAGGIILLDPAKMETLHRRGGLSENISAPHLSAQRRSRYSKFVKYGTG